jgi:ribonuclease HI
VVGILPISIYTDNQALAKGILDRAPKPTQYLTDEFLSLTEHINSTNLNRNSTPFTLKWISGHSGVAGNKKVDKEAKSAAEGNSSPELLLPPILCSPLPDSAPALRQEFKQQL